MGMYLVVLTIVVLLFSYQQVHRIDYSDDTATALTRGTLPIAKW